MRCNARYQPAPKQTSTKQYSIEIVNHTVSRFPFPVTTRLLHTSSDNLWIRAAHPQPCHPTADCLSPTKHFNARYLSGGVVCAKPRHVICRERKSKVASSNKAPRFPSPYAASAANTHVPWPPYNSCDRQRRRKYSLVLLEHLDMSVRLWSRFPPSSYP